MRAVALYQMLLGITVLIVGILGYADTNDYVMLIGGIVFGLDLIFIGFRMQKGWRPALYMSITVGLLLVGYFGKGWLVDDDSFYPSILITILSLLSLLLVALILVQPRERKRQF